MHFNFLLLKICCIFLLLLFFSFVKLLILVFDANLQDYYVSE